MQKGMTKTVVIVFGVFILLIGSAFVFTANNPSKIVSNPTPTIVTDKEEPQQKDTLSFKGEEGKDALTLLKGVATVEQNSSGLVTAINGRKADDSKKEFWGFYVNGKMAEVGPAEYQTKNEDTVEWKIETY